MTQEDNIDLEKKGKTNFLGKSYIPPLCCGGTTSTLPILDSSSPGLSLESFSYKHPGPPGVDVFGKSQQVKTWLHHRKARCLTAIGDVPNCAMSLALS